jgi:hypothetical protein
MMAAGFEDRQSHEKTVVVREPLVDINTEPACPAEPKIQLKLGRKRLTDINSPADPPSSDPKPQRRRLSEMAETDAPDPAPKPQPISGRPRLSLVHTEPSQTPPPEGSGKSLPDAETPAASQTTRATNQAEDPAWIEHWIADLRRKQNLSFAAVTGLLAAVMGAILWAAITVITNAQIGWMAIGVATLVGAVVRTLGRGLDKSFGWLGAGLALFSCILGNYLANCVFVAREVELPVLCVLTHIRPAAIPGLMIATFRPLDILFYALAIMMGYRLSFRRITEAQIQQAQAKA